jgi:hypothetical protein
VKILKKIKEIREANEVRPLQNNDYEELPDIDAYEAEQRRLFQEAVNEFRGNKGIVKIEDYSKKQSNVTTNVFYNNFSQIIFYSMLDRIFLI